MPEIPLFFDNTISRSINIHLYFDIFWIATSLKNFLLKVNLELLYRIAFFTDFPFYDPTNDPSKLEAR